MKKNKRMSEEEILRAVRREIDSAMNGGGGSEVSTLRQTMYDRFIGKPLENDAEEKAAGRSVYRSREVFETVMDAIPSLLRVLFSSDRPLEFVPIGEEDQKLAEQESDIVNQIVMGESFSVFYDILMQVLLDPVAYSRVSVKKQRHYDIEHYRDLHELDYQALLADENVELVEEEVYQKRVDPLETDPSAVYTRMAAEATGEQVAPVQMINCYDVKVRRFVDFDEVKIESIPGEDMLVSPRLESLDLDEADFVAHRYVSSVSDLVEAGYDYDEIMDVGAEGSRGTVDSSSEKENRRFLTDEENISTGWAAGEANPTVTVHECYIRMDADGDRYAELRRIVVIGNKIFENEEVSYLPFVAHSAIPLPFRHVGIPYAEPVEQLQRLGTALWRELLDSVYAVNRQRKFVNTRAFDTTDGLTHMLNRASEVVEVDGDPHASILFDQTTSLAQDILPVIEAVEQKRRLQTGVAPDMALDPEVLKRATASTFAGAQDRSMARLEMLVRVLAETGFRKLAQKTHRALRSHGIAFLALKVRGKLVSTDPSKWAMRNAVTVNVGIGYNSRQQIMDAAMQVLAIQEKAAAYGLVEPRHAFAALAKAVDASGLGFAGTFFNDPSSPDWKPPEPKPSPDEILAQAEMEKVKSSVQIEQQRLQVEMEREFARTQLEIKKMEAEIRKLDLESKLAEAKMELELRKLEAQDRKIMLDSLAEDHKLDLERAKVSAAIFLQGQQAVLARAQATALGVEADEAIRTAQEILEDVGVMIDESARSDNEGAEGEAGSGGEESSPARSEVEPGA